MPQGIGASGSGRDFCDHIRRDVVVRDCEATLPSVDIDLAVTRNNDLLYRKRRLSCEPDSSQTIPVKNACRDGK